MLFSIEKANRINRRFLWIGERLSRLLFSTKYDLQKAELDIDAPRYLTASVFSAVVYGLLFFGFVFALLFARAGAIENSHYASAALGGVLGGLMFFMLHVIYPGVMAKQIAEKIDKSLLFALKSILIQITSGISLFDALSNVAKAKYGKMSEEFEEVVKEVSAGESETKAMEKLAIRTRSEHLKKITWQLITSLRSGASLVGALNASVTSLTNYQLRAIKNYAAELNLWILIYLLLAAAVPTIGITFMIILSAIGGASIDPLQLWFVVFAAFAIQVVLIGFIKNRIPMVMF